MPKPITQSDMEAVFALTDALGIHRESVTVPIARRDPGGVKQLPGGMVQISLPESVDVGAWVNGVLRDALADLGFDELP